MPGFATICDAGYAFIASHRRLFDRLDRWFIGTQETLSTYCVSRWLFLRGLAIIYLIAFVSLFVQIDGLIGSKGILPIAPLLDAVRAHTGTERYWLLPTLTWISASDTTLHGLCIGGIVLSMLLVIGIAPVIVLALLWADYLSLVVAGQDFLNFQWDILLLETGFVAIFLAPGNSSPDHSLKRVPHASASGWCAGWRFASCFCRDS